MTPGFSQYTVYRFFPGANLFSSWSSSHKSVTVTDCFSKYFPKVSNWNYSRTQSWPRHELDIFKLQKFLETFVSVTEGNVLQRNEPTISDVPYRGDTTCYCVIVLFTGSFILQCSLIKSPTPAAVDIAYATNYVSAYQWNNLLTHLRGNLSSSCHLILLYLSVKNTSD